MHKIYSMHDDSPHTFPTACNVKHRLRDETEDGAEQKQHSQALLQSLQGWDRGGSMCLIQHTAAVSTGDSLLLSQQLWGYWSLQMNSVHCYLIVILTHTSIPKLLAPKIPAPTV